MNLDDYLKYNKVSTGIDGFDKLLYGGLVIPKSESILIVIRGNDNTEKTVFSLQLINEIASAFKHYNDRMTFCYYSNYLKKSYLEDLLLDILIASAIRQLIRLKVQGGCIEGSSFTKSFFDTKDVICNNGTPNLTSIIPKDYFDKHSDEMLCTEALYYNNRTNALHLRVSHQDSNTSNEKNAVYHRKYEALSEYFNAERLNEDAWELDYVERLLGIRYVMPCINDEVPVLADITSAVQNSVDKDTLVCLNLVNRKCNPINTQDICCLVKQLKKYKLSILVVRNDVKIPEEQADMIIDLTTNQYESSDYLLNYLCIYKSRFQTTALHTHQYKRRDYGIEVYPSLHLYCQQRRYLQRALVYTHSNVIAETFQQYLDKSECATTNYMDYLDEQQNLERGYFNALSPTAYKKFTLSNVLDTIFINPIKNIYNHGDTQSRAMKLENDFLYGNNGGITAIIGEANTFKRFITFGSAFSSAYRKEHTLFLLLNKDDKIVRRRLQCPSRKNKGCSDTCQECYKYLHFMNIMLGCITPEEFLYFLFQQIDTLYDGESIKRIIIDDLQIVEYCFPFLFQDPLFIPALVDECRERKIALYILCDKNSVMTKSLQVLADNVVCTGRNKKGNLEIYVERYSGYNAKPSEIFAGRIRNVDEMFMCYECGSRGNRQTFYKINSNEIELMDIYSMSEYWNADK